MVPKGTVVVVNRSKVHDPYACDAVKFMRGGVEFEPETGLSLVVEKACVYEGSGEMVLKASLLKAQGFGRLLQRVIVRGIRVWMPR